MDLLCLSKASSLVILSFEFTYSSQAVKLTFESIITFLPSGKLTMTSGCLFPSSVLKPFWVSNSDPSLKPRLLVKILFKTSSPHAPCFCPPPDMKVFAIFSASATTCVCPVFTAVNKALMFPRSSLVVSSFSSINFFKSFIS